MGMYCCCDVKIQVDWKCKCDQTGWHKPSKELPKENGKYLVRFSSNCGDRSEDEVKFSKEKEFIFQAGWNEEQPSHWDTRMTDDIVYQWKKNE